MTTQKHIKQYLEQLARHYATGHATEHTYRPALQALLESLIPGVLVTNEPKQIDCGAPDFVLTRNHIPLGYVEAKDIDKNLDDKIHKEQLARYTESLDNLLFTNYREFRLFRNAKRVATVTIAECRDRRIKPTPNNFAAFTNILTTFAGYQGQTITTAADLAARMAVKARMMAAVITEALARDDGEAKTDDRAAAMRSALQGQMHAFRKHLIHDIEPLAFADIYAQTVAYGMFAARLHDPTPATFTRAEAAELIPVNNPFLRKFFQHIAGYDLDARIRWIVDDLADVFRAADVGALMQDYGKATQRNDPFLHFYETFLGAYNPKLRKSRGVYYTPEPVVHFIVRAVDEILRTEFDLSQGLADTAKTVIEIDAQPSAGHDNRKGKNKKYKKEVHRIQILDPATGTGTFLAAIVQQIYARQFSDHKGVWPNYVREELIPRLNGFEVLMASYAMAHTKLEMVLRESGCDLGAQRLRIFLTNALEEHHPDTGSLFSQWLSTEANEANFIKRDTPVMVVIGNPPYSGVSSNMGEWISELIEDYKYVDGEHFGERKHWLNDDYVKFIRYGQHHIDRTGTGILAFINNHGFLDNPTFRGMRWSLLQSFDAIYILDLHGNSKKKETAPDGSPDKNVFDIQQGVSINLFVKTGNKKKGALARVFHHDLYGERESKYEFLWDNNLNQVKFQKLAPQSPYYFFIPRNTEGRDEYQKGFPVTDMFPVNVTGIVTARDKFVTDIDKNKLLARIVDFTNLSQSDEEIRIKYFGIGSGRKYPRGDSRGWKMVEARKKIMDYDHRNLIRRVNYRPFDSRYIYYHPDMVDWGRETIMHHFIAGENVGLVTSRITKDDFSVLCTKHITAHKNATRYDISYIFPLYLYPETEQQNIDNQQTRKPNLAPNIVKTIAASLGLTFTPEKQTAEKTSDKTFAPIDLLDYIYAILHSPTYREKYKAFLKIDFPRVPYPIDKKQFRQLIKLGGQLRTLHLLENPTLDPLITGYPETGDHIITKPEYKITDPKKRVGNVNINKKQYFSNVPETAWNFHIGGYQPAQKWLKDRKSRELTPDEIFHYQKIIVALTETARLMGEIDRVMARDGR